MVLVCHFTVNDDGGLSKKDLEDLVAWVMAIAECCLMNDDWPKYYYGKNGCLMGKSSHKFPTWKISEWLVTKLLRANSDCLYSVSFEEDTEAIASVSNYH